MKPGVRGTPQISGGLKGRRSPLRHPFRVHADGAVRPIPGGFTPGLAPAALQAAGGCPRLRPERHAVSSPFS